MPLETSAFLSGLTASWPIASDPKSQGDDHLRLIKNVLQSTFPSADRAFYFPKTEAASANLTLDATDQNNTVFVTTTGSDFAINLPSGFGAAQAGWSCEVVKVSPDYFAAVVFPASGTILSRSGNTASIRVGSLCEPVRFVWTGSGWVCSKPGPVIGSTISFDGATTPFGYLVLDGSVFSSVTFAELAAVLGTTTLRDKRGRTEIGADPGQVNMSATYYGATPSINVVGGGQSVSLAIGNLPQHLHAGTTGVESADHTHTTAVPAIMSGATNYGGGLNYGLTSATPNVTSSGRSAAHTHAFTTDANGSFTNTPFSRVPPSIAVAKLIRAC